MGASPLHFKNVPKSLNISGASTNTINSTFSVTSTPFSVQSDISSVSRMPHQESPLHSSGLNRKTIFGHEYPATSTPNTLNSVQRKKFVPNSYSCSFCDESLHNIFEGERLVDLECGHSIHYNCFTEMITPVDLFNTATDPTDLKNEVFCSSCNAQTSCADGILMKSLQNTQLLQKVDDLFKPESANINMNDLLSSIDNYELSSADKSIGVLPELTDIRLDYGETLEVNIDEHDHSQTISLIDDSEDDMNYSFDGDDDPTTPQGQMGMNFWEKRDDDIKPLAADTIERRLRPQPESSLNSDLELVKISFAPEFSSINKTEQEGIEIGCVLNISATEFEAPLESNRMELIKTQIGKNKITDYIIELFENNIVNETLDTTSIGGLILFDFMDVTLRADTFTSCQVFLFDTNIIILNSVGDTLLLNQDLNTQTFISSTYENQDTIIINLNSMKLPSLSLTTKNKILKHKWFVTLTKLSKNVDMMDVIPLIQISTNAWSLLENGSNDDIVPEDIKIVNKLTSRGLDLPSKFLKRQILRPDSIPKVIIIVLPLVNCEDYGLENNEFAEAIKKILQIVLNSMTSSSKLGVVFLGGHIKDLNSIGNYYGCVNKDWVGWKDVLDSITENVISSAEENMSCPQWETSWKYVERLSKLGFEKSNGKSEYLNQIIFVSNELLLKTHARSQKSHKTNHENPFLVNRPDSNLNYDEKIMELCNSYEANFSYIVLADEFRFEPKEIIQMNQYLQESAVKVRNQGNVSYNNRFQLQLALDFESLASILELEIDMLNKVTVRVLETKIKFPSYVKLASLESPYGKVSVKEDESQFDNTYTIKLNSLSSGYEKSLFFSVNLDTQNELLVEELKAELASCRTKVVANKIESEFDSNLNVKFITPTANMNNSNMTISLNINEGEQDVSSIYPDDIDMSLPIVSKLSSVTDAFFIRRKIQLLVVDKLQEAVLSIDGFDLIAKENAIRIFKDLISEIWELANSCNSSNTNNINEKNILKWSESLIEELESIIDGYSLRNYQLSNMKCVELFLKLE